MDNYKELVYSLRNDSCINTNCDRVGRVRQVLFNLNHPDQNFRIIHVVGTHGKKYFINALLPLMGQSKLKIAYFCRGESMDPCRRIQINGQAINQDDYVRNYWQVYCHLPLDMAENSLTLEEWTFLIALNYFAKENVDWLILPADMGGIGDTSNAISVPELVIVTSCCMDHWRKLGTTTRQIARAKAGVVKNGTKAVIVGPEIKGEFHENIANFVRKKGAKIIESSQFVTLAIKKEGQQLAYLQVVTPRQHFKLALSGQPDEQQVRNIYLLLTVANWLKENGLKLKTPVLC